MRTGSVSHYNLQQALLGHFVVVVVGRLLTTQVSVCLSTASNSHRTQLAHRALKVPGDQQATPHPVDSPPLSEGRLVLVQLLSSSSKRVGASPHLGHVHASIDEEVAQTAHCLRRGSDSDADDTENRPAGGGYVGSNIVDEGLFAVVHGAPDRGEGDFEEALDAVWGELSSHKFKKAEGEVGEREEARFSSSIVGGVVEMPRPTRSVRLYPYISLYK